ncbi:cytochrome C oxidase subunit III [Caulobacter sp. 17J80-11]|uniref:cytochrome C oxidase subunit III n=1 Tax=Caulobacter sp. 17J80-11 TaxID=2763502 RepID=UPI001653C6CC|nr:cytochrome C oxidase subunit III [Caulobacter sp. 17J80-11]MBC6982562.1 cytochrome C oxidase subunit III [Caulobacter sp. 17J80-11]
MIRTRVVGDLSTLPDHAFGLRSILFWGVIGFMLVEGTVFVLAGGVYLYLRGLSPTWPPEPVLPPSLIYSAIFTLALFATELPNRWLNRRARALDLRATRAGLVLMTVLGLALLLLRAFEFPHLNVRWDQNAYGSVVWMLMILHTTHLITDWADTAVFTVWTFTHDVGPDQFSDASDNCAYWTFVVWTWLPIYALVYWAPRLT